MIPSYDTGKYVGLRTYQYPLVDARVSGNIVDPIFKISVQQPNTNNRSGIFNRSSLCGVR